MRLLERFRLSADGATLLSTQEFEDPEMLENRGARFIAWKKKAGEHVYPYECDPTFALEYQEQIKAEKIVAVPVRIALQDGAASLRAAPALDPIACLAFGPYISTSAFGDG